MLYLFHHQLYLSNYQCFAQQVIWANSLLVGLQISLLEATFWILNLKNSSKLVSMLLEIAFVITIHYLNCDLNMLKLHYSPRIRKGFPFVSQHFHTSGNFSHKVDTLPPPSTLILALGKWFKISFLFYVFSKNCACVCPPGMCSAISTISSSM